MQKFFSFLPNVKHVKFIKKIPIFSEMEARSKQNEPE